MSATYTAPVLYVRCLGCREIIRITRSQVGQRLRCRHCQHAFQVVGDVGDRGALRLVSRKPGTDQAVEHDDSSNQANKFPMDEGLDSHQGFSPSDSHPRLFIPRPKADPPAPLTGVGPVLSDDVKRYVTQGSDDPSNEPDGPVRPT